MFSGQVLMMGKDPRYFKDPVKFKPERWLRGNEEIHHAFAALPFGFGPRMCLGKCVQQGQRLHEI